MRATWSQSTARVRAWKASTLLRACSFTSSANARPTSLAPSAERRGTPRSTSSAAPAVRCAVSRPRRAASPVRSIASRAAPAPSWAVRLPSSATLSVAFPASVLAVCAMTVFPLYGRMEAGGGSALPCDTPDGAMLRCSKRGWPRKSAHAGNAAGKAELKAHEKASFRRELADTRCDPRKDRLIPRARVECCNAKSCDVPQVRRADLADEGLDAVPQAKAAVLRAVVARVGVEL